MKFDYNKAFGRNIGWITESEQALLQKKTVAIAGLGGVGGHHAINLARLGIENFHLADFDIFEVQNFNRQAGASVSTLSRKKLDVTIERILDINPNIQIKQFAKGISSENINEFLTDVDIYVDGLDAFVLDIRHQVFTECAKRNIPATTVAPIGAGAALLNFLPGGMSFEDYFGFAGKNEKEKIFRFICGLTPSFIQMKALVDRTRSKIEEKVGPSLSAGCYLSSGVMSTEVLKILLKRGPVECAPVGLHFDAYSYRYRKTWMPGGKYNPIFLIKVLLLEHLLKKQ